MNKLIQSLERPETVKILRRLFYVFLVALLVIDPFIDKHGFFPWENVFGFYVFYGFISCALIIAFSKIIGKLWLQRGEDYYD